MLVILFWECTICIGTSHFRLIELGGITKTVCRELGLGNRIRCYDKEDSKESLLHITCVDETEMMHCCAC